MPFISAHLRLPPEGSVLVCVGASYGFAAFNPRRSVWIQEYSEIPAPDAWWCNDEDLASLGIEATDIYDRRATRSGQMALDLANNLPVPVLAEPSAIEGSLRDGEARESREVECKPQRALSEQSLVADSDGGQFISPTVGRADTSRLNRLSELSAKMGVAE